MIRRSGVAMVTVSVAAGFLALATAIPAAAAPPKTPAPEDPRATVVQGDNAVTCAQAGLPGTIFAASKPGDDLGQYVTVTVPDGIEVTGVVVKGGHAYNVYKGNILTDLRAPTNNGGNIPTISHWFACGIKKSDTPTQPNPPGGNNPGNGGTPGGTGGTGNPPAAQGSNAAATGAELADTGFATTVPLILGGVLLVLGAGLLFGLRRSFRRQN